MAGKRSFFRLSFWAAALFLLCLPAFSLANRRGSLSCFDPEDAYAAAAREPDDFDYITMKGMCLIAADNKDGQGLYELQRASDQNIVYATFLIAIYRKTEGGFEKAKFFQPDITVPIEAYKKVWNQIVHLPNYPHEDFGLKLDEQRSRIKLHAAYSLPLLYFYRYFRGLVGHHSAYVSQSPSNTRTEFDFYPKDQGVTVDSLNRMNEWAQTCKNISYEEELWDREAYDHFMGLCDILQKAALKAIPLEQQRLQAAKHCEDILKCPEYTQLATEIVSWFKKTEERLIKAGG